MPRANEGRTTPVTQGAKTWCRRKTANSEGGVSADIGGCKYHLEALIRATCGCIGAFGAMVSSGLLLEAQSSLAAFLWRYRQF